MSEGQLEVKVKWWVSIFKDVGLPVIMLGAIMYAMWQGGGWFANNMAKPLFEKQMKLFDDQSEMIKDTKSAINTIAESVKDSETSDISIMQNILTNRDVIKECSKAQIDLGSQQLETLKKIEEKIQ